MWIRVPKGAILHLVDLALYHFPSEEYQSEVEIPVFFRDYNLTLKPELELSIEERGSQTSDITPINMALQGLSRLPILPNFPLPDPGLPPTQHFKPVRQPQDRSFARHGRRTSASLRPPRCSSSHTLSVTPNLTSTGATFNFFCGILLSFSRANNSFDRKWIAPSLLIPLRVPQARLARHKFSPHKTRLSLSVRSQQQAFTNLGCARAKPNSLPASAQPFTTPQGCTQPSLQLS
ncbi:hypothetical protein QQF64_033874 [Cirrhinus molitorella]|uniref:Uncharacterized protein n=1 Tax=Cirrhinus molitorella TaxID=172907 RepID=A0ABR3MV31_9TELE